MALPLASNLCPWQKKNHHYNCICVALICIRNTAAGIFPDMVKQLTLQPAHPVIYPSVRWKRLSSCLYIFFFNLSMCSTSQVTPPSRVWSLFLPLHSPSFPENWQVIKLNYCRLNSIFKTNKITNILRRCSGIYNIYKCSLQITTANIMKLLLAFNSLSLSTNTAYSVVPCLFIDKI